MHPADDRTGSLPIRDTDTDADALRARVAALEAEAALLRRRLAADAGPGAADGAAPGPADGPLLRQILDGFPDHAVFTTDLERRVTAWNEGAHRLLGWSETEVLGRRIDLVFTPEDQAKGDPEREAARSLAEGQATEERWHVRRDGSRFWGREVVLPLRGPDGRPEGLIKVMRDRTAEREAEERLRESEERLRQMADAIDDVFWISQPAPPRLSYVSPAFERVWGIPPGSLFRDQAAWLDSVHPEDRARVREAFYDRALAEERYDVEYRILRPDGAVRWVHDRGWPLAGQVDGAPRRFAGLASDVTARHEAEERRRVLVAELNHRVKNTLATVQSLARQTGRAAASPVEFTAAFEGRLLALARAHDLLTREDWRGAAVADVARGALAPHLASGRVSLAPGPPLRIGPREAVALAMALGELANNAAKHGALSTEDGRVSVSWRADADGGGVLSWEESGGPPVAAAPSRRGFGMRLLAQGLRQDLRAAAELDFAPSGLRCAIRFPVAGT